MFDELKKNLDESGKDILLDLVDGLCELREISNMIFYKAGIKKAVNVFIDG